MNSERRCSDGTIVCKATRVPEMREGSVPWEETGGDDDDDGGLGTGAIVGIVVAAVVVVAVVIVLIVLGVKGKLKCGGGDVVDA